MRLQKLQSTNEEVERNRSLKRRPLQVFGVGLDSHGADGGRVVLPRAVPEELFEVADHAGVGKEMRLIEFSHADAHVGAHVQEDVQAIVQEVGNLNWGYLC